MTRQVWYLSQIVHVKAKAVTTSHVHPNIRHQSHEFSGSVSTQCLCRLVLLHRRTTVDDDIVNDCLREWSANFNLGSRELPLLMTLFSIPAIQSAMPRWEVSWRNQPSLQYFPLLRQRIWVSLACPRLRRLIQGSLIRTVFFLREVDVCSSEQVFQGMLHVTCNKVRDYQAGHPCDTRA